MNLRGKIPRRSAGGGHNVNVAAGGSFVAHEAFDECHRLAVGRNVRLGDLPFRSVDLAHVSGQRVNRDTVSRCTSSRRRNRGQRSQPSLGRRASSHIRKCTYPQA